MARRSGSSRRWRKLRAEWAEVIAYGAVACSRCGDPIRPGDRWHLGHRIALSQGGRDTRDNTAPEHAACNLAGSAAPVTPPNPPTFAW